MPRRRRYSWHHPHVELYVLTTNSAVRVVVEKYGRQWRLEINRAVIGSFRKFSLLEAAIPADALHAPRT